VLGKRRTDLTGADVEVMERVVDDVDRLLSARGATGLDDQQWRGDLMSLGHDPLKD
jgi:hypothetical protein